MKPDGKRVPVPVQVARILPEHLEPGSLSLVVFGPGHGEAMVVVLPDGTVGVIDGCREPTVRDPVREFLDILSAQPGYRGKPFHLDFVCLTHPHEDHYRGLGHLLGAFATRIKRVWRIHDVGDRYAKALLDYLSRTKPGPDLLPDMDDIKSLARIIREMRLAHRKHGTHFRHLQQGKLLLERKWAGKQLRITGCGPADVDVETAQFTLLAIVSKTGKLPEFDPNAASGALLIRWGQAGMLLGGDLLGGSKKYKGWDGVHEEIKGPVQVVKAAHHASVGAHHDELLKRLRPRLTIVTPFLNAQANQPPRPEQVQQLAKRSVVAITAVPLWEPLPHPLYATAEKPTERITSGGFPPALPADAAPGVGEDDADNAVAVSLDAKGRLVRFVLAGKANVYGP